MGKITPQQRRQQVLDTMRVTGADEITAEFIVAQELGEIESDIIDGDDNSDETAED